MKRYNKLRGQYPEYVSLDQFHRICKIAKRSARYLVEHGIVPAIDTGNKTWRYRIALDDVIAYLRRREKVGSMIPPGAVSNRPQQQSRHIRKPFSQFLPSAHEGRIEEYFRYLYAEYDDILAIIDIIEMTGLSRSTVLRLLQTRAMPALVRRPKYLIPKESLIAFVATRTFLEMRTTSEQFIKILGGFEIWLKSSQ